MITQIPLAELLNIYFSKLHAASQGYRSVGGFAEVFLRTLVKDKTRKEAGMTTELGNDDRSILPDRTTLYRINTNGKTRYRFKALTCRGFERLDDQIEFDAFLSKAIADGRKPKLINLNPQEKL